MRKSTVINIKLLGCGLLVFLRADIQAQLLKKVQFTPAEGYTNGWLIGQPSIGTKWENANGDENFGGYNNGASWTNSDGSPFFMATATNFSGTKWAMKIASDGNNGTNGAVVYYWRMPFPKTLVGPITVTWDWQYFPTNPIPSNYDVSNSCPITEFGVAQPSTATVTNADESTSTFNLQTTDVGFTLADSANAELGGNPNVVFNELCTPTRFGGDQVADARFNAVDPGTGGVGGGGGDWFKRGPRYQDGKLIHERIVAYVGLTGAAADTNNTYAVWAQRDGEEVMQIAKPEGDPDYGTPDTPKPMPQFGLRRNPGEADPTSGINCITLWMNSSPDKVGTYVLISNIRVVGPNPVAVPALSISQTGLVNFGGWLEAADAPQGPYTTVAVTSPYQVPPGTGTKFYRASN